MCPFCFPLPSTQLMPGPKYALRKFFPSTQLGSEEWAVGTWTAPITRSEIPPLLTHYFPIQPPFVG